MLEALGNLKRTNYCGALRATDADKEVVLMGWVHRRRDLGQLIFIDLRDRAGIAQIVFNKELHAEAHKKAEELRSEYVVAVEGRVLRRQKSNPEISTGEVEVMATRLHILNNSKTPPFPIRDNVDTEDASEETRLRYRYLDLRRFRLQRNIRLRHNVVLAIRNYLDSLRPRFLEIETPVLTRSTPEGARDYLVPSRVHHGQFYALPQSPQIFKQILMISGMERYFQIVKCFRDEDLRADRQPEFTQLDLEMSFVDQDDVFQVIEGAIKAAFGRAAITLDKLPSAFEVKAPFRHLDYREALRRFGSDKPDLRFGLELHNVTTFFEPARSVLQLEGNVQAIVVPAPATFSRKQIDELSEFAKSAGARGAYTIKVTPEGISSSLEKNLGADALKRLAEIVGAKPGDWIIASAAKQQIPHTDTSLGVAGQLRRYLGEKLGLVDRSKFEFAWITGFALFEWSEADKRWVSAQHPFTGIVEEDIEKLESAPWECRSKGYDLVLNGYELGSGSIRIHRQDVQARMFKALGLTDEQARQRFGFFLDALTYGTPPHGGIALGIDRIAMLLAGEKSLREVIAFPKTTAAQDLMADSPSSIEAPQEETLEIMAAFPDLDSRNWELAGFCDRLVSHVDKEALSRLLPADTHYQQAMTLIFAKSRDDARAVIRLAKAGYGLQASGLSRSLVEAAINSLYIQLDPETHGGSYVNSMPASQRRLALRLAPHASTEEMRNLVKSFQEAEDTSGWPTTLRQRAEAIGRPMYLYDTVYLLLSQILHGDVASMAGRLSGGSSGKFKMLIGRSNEWVEQALATCFIGLHQVTLVSFKAFALSTADLDSLGAEFEAFSQSLRATS